MQQVTHWLEKLRMSEYARRFADNDIALSILCDLAPNHWARHRPAASLAVFSGWRSERSNIVYTQL